MLQFQGLRLNVLNQIDRNCDRFEVTREAGMLRRVNDENLSIL
jgi:hypothetical protein